MLSSYEHARARVRRRAVADITATGESGSLAAEAVECLFRAGHCQMQSMKYLYTT